MVETTKYSSKVAPKPAAKPVKKEIRVFNIRDPEAPVFSDITNTLFYNNEYGLLSPDLAKLFMRKGYVEADL